MAPFFLCASLLLWVFPPLCIGRSLENRLESLEQTVYTLQTTLVEKDNRISHLENQLSEVNARVSVLELLLDKEVDEQESGTRNVNADIITELSDQVSNRELSGKLQERKVGVDYGRQRSPTTQRILHPFVSTSRQTDEPEFAASINSMRADAAVLNQERKGEEMSGQLKKRKIKLDHGKQRSPNTRRFSDHSLCTRASVTSPKIAFHAYQSSDLSYGTHATMQFDVETIDIGQGYNSGDSIYDVPVTGVYVFTWTSLSAGHSNHRAELLINGIVKDSTWADSENSADFHEATGIIVAQVNQGDHVFVRIGSISGGQVLSSINIGRTTFKGWLLFTM